MPWKELNLMDQRTEFVLRALRTDNFRALCQEHGISPKTGYKWCQRFTQHGLEGLADASRRPRNSPAGLAEGVVCEIVHLKNAHRAWGPRKIRALYQRLHGPPTPSESSFKRILEKAGLVERRRLRPRRQAGRLATGRTASAPNEIWTVDFKGWWYDRHQQRCEPLTVRDEYSRYVLDIRAVPDARTETVRACFERLFQRFGLPGALRSDNGAPFASTRGVLGLSRLSAWWLVLGIDLERGRPACPQDNGAHERLHLDISRELENPATDQAALDQWRQNFNDERPHEALAMSRPCEYYQPSVRTYEGTPPDLSYQGLDQRRVTATGQIHWAGQTLFISEALSGWSVGLEPRGAGIWDLWFGKLLLGQLDQTTARFQRTPGPQEGGAP